MAGDIGWQWSKYGWYGLLWLLQDGGEANMANGR